MVILLDYKLVEGQFLHKNGLGNIQCPNQCRPFHATRLGNFQGV